MTPVALVAPNVWICHIPDRSAGEWASQVCPAGPAEPVSARPQLRKGSCRAPEEGPDLWGEVQGREGAGLRSAGPLGTHGELSLSDLVPQPRASSSGRGP